MTTNEKINSFMGNVERSIEISKMAEISKVTGEVTKLGERDGVALYKAPVIVAVDTRFPTKAGNTTTTVIIVPVDGAKEFSFNGGKLKFDGIAPFIYGGRGVSHVFTVLDDTGDIMKRPTARRSAQKEIDALNAKMDTIMAALAAMAKK